MFKKFRFWIKREPPHKSQTDSIDKKMVANLMVMLKNTQEGELSCDEVYELLDEYAEFIVNIEDADQFMPLIKHHLDMCKDCNEEYESLISFLNAKLA